MGMLVYLILFAGFFALMMRFGCGAHVLGHDPHGDHRADGNHNLDKSNRSTEAQDGGAIRTRDHQHD